MLEIIGRFHPLIVHLPIGLLIMALFMEGVSFHTAFRFLRKLVGITLLLGIISAMLSLLSGHLLSLEGNHPQDSTNDHKWIAFVTTLLFVFYYMVREHIMRIAWLHIISLFLLGLMISATGHLGGNLTHGEGYLRQVPADKISMIDPVETQILSELENMGWVISPLSKEDNHVRVTGFNVSVPMKEAIAQLARIRDHVVELKLSHTAVMDTDLEKVTVFGNLKKLWLDNTQVTDAAVSSIVSLKELHFINLAYTKISDKGIKSIVQLPALGTAFIPEHQLDTVSWNAIVKQYPRIKFHIGKDTMNRVITDTLFDKKVL